MIGGAQVAAPITPAAQRIKQIELIVKIADVVDIVKEGLNLLDDAVRIKRACVHGLLLSLAAEFLWPAAHLLRRMVLL